jgi:DnaK suppressor protein
MTDTTTRNRELRLILSTRQSEMRDAVRKRIRHAPARATDVGDTIDRSDTDVQDGMDLALLQMRTEMLARIDEALLRLDAGDYGICAACAGEITERRLRALPFAVRCQTCEGARELDQGRARLTAQRRAGFTLFPEPAAT